MKKYKEIPVPVKASFCFMLCSILQKGISMITVPLFTRLLTTTEYGLFSVYQSWYSIFAIFSSLNLSDAVFNTGMVKYPEDKDDFTLSLQSLTSIITLGLLFVYLIAIDFWNSIFDLSTLLILSMFIELMFIPAYSFWCARQKFEYKYVTLMLFTMLIAISCPTVAVIAIHFSTNRGVARIMSFTMVQATIGLGFYVVNLHRGKKLVKLKYWKYALTFSIPLIPHYLSMTILRQADRIMISKMIGTGEAAIYSIAYNISQIMLLVTSAINNSFIPYTYRCLKKQNYRELRKNSDFLLIIVAVITAIMMLMGPELVKIFATSEYYDAVWIIPPVAVSVFFLFLYPMFSNIEFYFEKSSIAMSASIVGAVANILLNYIFIQLFGYIAAGYTTLVCYMIFAIMHYWGMKKVLHENGISEKVYDVKIIIIISLVLSVLMIGVLVIYSNTILRYLMILLLCIIIFSLRKTIINTINGLKNNKERK